MVYSPPPSIIMLSTPINSVTPAPLPLLLYGTFPIQAIKLESFQKDQNWQRVIPPKWVSCMTKPENRCSVVSQLLGWRTEAGEWKQERSPPNWSLQHAFFSLLFFPLWAWLGVRREDPGQGHACCLMTLTLRISKKHSQCPGHFGFSISIWIY